MYSFSGGGGGPIKKKKAPVTYATAPGTPAGEAVITPTPLVKKIAAAQKDVEEVWQNIEENYQLALVEKLFDFKPYKAVDPKPLTKYEDALMLIEMLECIKPSSILAKALKDLPGGKLTPSHEAYRVEQFANMPAGVRNLLCREFLSYSGFSCNEAEKGYLLEKLGDENKSVNKVIIKETVKKKWAVRLELAEKKLKALQTPPAKGKK